MHSQIYVNIVSLNFGVIRTENVFNTMYLFFVYLVTLWEMVCIYPTKAQRAQGLVFRNLFFVLRFIDKTCQISL